MASKRVLRKLCDLPPPPFRTNTTGGVRSCDVYFCTSVTPASRKAFSSSTHARQEAPPDSSLANRWQQTPPGMVGVRFRPKPINNDWTVNEDSRRLDQAYLKFLGKGGDKLLTEETKWLAVTHKSFDQGKRGFNDKLAYLGRRIVELQASLALLNAPRGPVSEASPQVDLYGREPFQHPSLRGLENVTDEAKSAIVSKSKLADLADSYGMRHIIRWRPRKASDLKGSGLETVLAQTMYAVVGALALERGGEVARRMTQERILAPLGLR